MNEKSPVLYINNEKCTDSYSCVRVCPVKAIEVSPDKEHPVILGDRCIGCGLCFVACAAGAIEYRSSIESVKGLLESGEESVALVAPSIASEFDDITDYRKLVAMIRSLGFKWVHEVSFGVDLVAAEYRRLFESSKGKYYISSNCPSIVKMVRKYYPDMVPNLAPIVSPAIASGIMAKKLHGEKSRVVFIGPCIDSKDEINSIAGKPVDSVLTFLELRTLFNEFGVQEKNVKFSDFDPPHGNWGALYPIPAGILHAAGIKRDLMESGIITASGREESVEALNDFNSHIDTIKHHFNLFFCPGCLLGPGMEHHNERFRRRDLVRRYTSKRVGALDIKRWEADMKRWSEINLSSSFMPDDQRLAEPPEEVIKEVLKIIGKESHSNEGNCRACGYDSCRDFAVTVAQGLTIPEMCHKFNLRNKQEYIDKLRKTNKKLADTQKALIESEKFAIGEREIAREASDTLSAMLEELPSGVVIVDNNLKVVHSNAAFVNIIGEDAREIVDVIPGLKGADLKSLLPFNIYNMFTFAFRQDESIISRDVKFDDRMLNISVFPIRSNRVAGAILRDLYSPEVQSEEVIARVSEVIDRNLAMVQKIGFLLGEGASETEQMLNSILESYRNKVSQKRNE